MTGGLGLRSPRGATWCAALILAGKRIDGRDLKAAARSAARSACCRGRTARRCSPAARRRPWCRHARHRQRRAAGRRALRGVHQEVHAGLQLPAVLGRRVQPIRGPGRREIGHGASRSGLEAVMPEPGEVPLHDPHRLGHHSSRTAPPRWPRVCGGYAGADGRRRADHAARSPASPSVSSRKATRYVLLTDIMGDEDHFGDMDFKVAGTGRASPASSSTSRSTASTRRSSGNARPGECRAHAHPG